mmetsp:Transcript_3546/g.8465  ORF Transcript_3546/g.8465 Transcript_3546/m.8465 type:complete len:181 (+) Transcript_3546:219-761(+)
MIFASQHAMRRASPLQRWVPLLLPVTIDAKTTIRGNINSLDRVATGSPSNHDVDAKNSTLLLTSKRKSRARGPATFGVFAKIPEENSNSKASQIRDARISLEQAEIVTRPLESTAKGLPLIFVPRDAMTAIPWKSSNEWPRKNSRKEPTISNVVWDFFHLSLLLSLSYHYINRYKARTLT